MQNFYKPGSWNCICPVCGRQYKSDAMIKRWDGLFVCRQDWEPRHILDFAKVPNEIPPPPFNLPEAQDQFVQVFYVSLANGQADIGGADIAMTDYVNPHI